MILLFYVVNLDWTLYYRVITRKLSTSFTWTTSAPYNLLQECSGKIRNTEYLDHICILLNWPLSLDISLTHRPHGDFFSVP